MSKVVVDESSLTSVANAIRSKGGTSDKLTFPDGMVSAIENIPLLSSRKSVVVEVSTPSSMLAIPISGISTLQMVCVSMIDDDSYDGIRLFTLILFFNSSNSLTAIQTVADNDYDNVQYSLSRSTERYEVAKSSSYLTINSEAPASWGYFYGRYACEIIYS